MSAATANSLGGLMSAARRVRIAAIMVATAVLLAAPHVAAALPSQLTFVWEAPEGCPPGNEVSERIATFVTASSDSARRAPLFARARVTGNATVGFRVEVSTTDGITTGERTLRVNTCAGAAKAAAFVIALALNESARGEKPPPPPPTVVSARPLPGKVDWIIGARGTVGVGVLPSPSAGAGVVLGLQRGPWRLEAEAQMWAPRDVTLESDPRVGATFEGYTAALRGCSGPKFWGLRVGACLGAGGARVEARGFGTPRTMHVGEWQLGPLAGAFVAWSLSDRWTFRGQLDVVGRLLPRHTFGVYEDDPLYRAPFARVGASLGLDRHF